MRLQVPKSRRGISIYIFAIVLVLSIPFVGLMFDATLLYIIKTRLQGAVDGAVLAGLRGLSRGTDDPSQIASAKLAAVTFVKLNYPKTYFFSKEVRVDIDTDVIVDLSVSHERTIHVTAHALEPTLLMSWLGFSETDVSATATSLRRDVNLVLVLDRSGSVHDTGSCETVKAAAVNFVNKFAPGRDFLSLVSFANSVVVQVPITPTYTATSMAIAIDSIPCAGDTSSAAALWNGYQQLAALHQGGALNLIVFVTDGLANTVAANIPIQPASPCSDALIAGVPTPRGLPAGYTGKYITGTLKADNYYFGIYQNRVLPNPDGIIPDAIRNADDRVLAAHSTGCLYTKNIPTQNVLYGGDYLGIPTQDIYGNSLLNEAYYPATMDGPFIQVDVALLGSTNLNARVMVNAADDAARRIRIGDSDRDSGQNVSGVRIESIALGNAGLYGSDVFLKRVSNTTDSPIFDPNYASGKYIYITDAGQLDGAFNDIFAEVMRLSN